jgi:hypothetical protein
MSTAEGTGLIVSEEDMEAFATLSILPSFPLYVIPFKSGFIAIAVPVLAPTHYIFVKVSGLRREFGDERKK